MTARVTQAISKLHEALNPLHGGHEELHDPRVHTALFQLVVASQDAMLGQLVQKDAGMLGLGVMGSVVIRLDWGNSSLARHYELGSGEGGEGPEGQIWTLRWGTALGTHCATMLRNRHRWFLDLAFTFADGMAMLEPNPVRRLFDPSLLGVMDTLARALEEAVPQKL